MSSAKNRLRSMVAPLASAIRKALRGMLDAVPVSVRNKLGRRSAPYLAVPLLLTLLFIYSVVFNAGATGSNALWRAKKSTAPVKWAQCCDMNRRDYGTHESIENQTNSTSPRCMQCAIAAHDIGGPDGDVYTWAHRLRAPAIPPPLDAKSQQLNDTAVPVRWVLMVHTCGSGTRYRAIRATWFRLTAPDMALVAFGVRPRGLVETQRERFVNAPPVDGDFVGTKWAFLYAATEFPSAEMFSKFDDDSYVYTRHVAKALGLTRPLTPTTLRPPQYFGLAMYRHEPGEAPFVFASGGAGYSLSKAAVGLLARMAANGECSDDMTPYEDVGIGRCMLGAGIKLTELPGHHQHNPWQALVWDMNRVPVDQVSNMTAEWFLNPLSYHYITPRVMRIMHDDIYMHGMPLRRSRGLPKILHHVWLARSDTVPPPVTTMESCAVLNRGWQQRVWTNHRMHRDLKTDHIEGHLVNQKLFDAYPDSFALDAVRLEALLAHGGVFVDTNLTCVQPLDLLLERLFFSPDSNAHDGFLSYQSSVPANGDVAISGRVFGLFPYSPMAVMAVRELFKAKDIQQNAWHPQNSLFLSRLVKRVGTLGFSMLPPRAFSPFHRDIVAPSTVDERRAALRAMNAYTDDARLVPIPGPGPRQVLAALRVGHSHHNSTLGDVLLPPQWLVGAGKTRLSQPARIAANSDLGIVHVDNVAVKIGSGSGAGIKNVDQAVGDESVIPPQVLSQLEQLLRDYAVVHEDALSSTAAHSGQRRWVVALMDPAAGMCNRAMHLASSLLLAVLTDRALLFDWHAQAPRRVVAEQIETIGHSDYHDIFAAPPLAVSYRDALVWFGLDDAQARARHGVLFVPSEGAERRKQFLHLMRHFPLDAAFAHDQIVYIDRYDWWGAALFANPHYATLLGELGSARGFRLLFQYLFQPKQWRGVPPAHAADCNFLFQVRRQWERATAPASAFSKCAAEHGLTNANNVVVGTQYMLSDDATDVQLLQGAGLNVHLLSQACRDGTPACDQTTISSIYLASRCRRAVLTASSTFGACAVGLGLIADAYVIDASGACTRRAQTDPLEAGTLAAEPREVAAVIAEPSPWAALENASARGDTEEHAIYNQPTFPTRVVQTEGLQRQPWLRAAFVLLLHRQSEHGLAQFRGWLARFNEHTGARLGYPLVLFVDRVAKWRFLQFECPVRMHLVAVADADWVQLEASLDPAAGAAGDWSVASATRYTLLHMLRHAALARFDYIIRIDHARMPTPPWGRNVDPFLDMARRGGTHALFYGRNHLNGTHNQESNIQAVKLVELFSEWQSSNATQDRKASASIVAISEQQQGFVGMHTAWPRSQEFRSIVQRIEISERACWMELCRSDADVLVAMSAFARHRMEVLEFGGAL